MGKRERTPQGYLWLVEVPEDRPDQAAFIDYDAGPSGEFAVLQELVDTLQGQIKTKDVQISHLQRQNEDLLSALRAWQSRMLPASVPPAEGWWQRIWKR